MSDSFYDYISDHLISFFAEKNLKKGDKFLINFNNKKDVDSLYGVLERKNSVSFEYIDDEMKNPYNSFYLEFGEIKLIVAKLMLDSGFLVNLRNKVSSYSDTFFEDKALLIISDKVKDSIDGAMVNLQDDGYPLNIDIITKNFEEEISNTSLEPFEKEILNVFLDRHSENELYKTTIWDFQTVFSILSEYQKEGKHIEPEDFQGLNLFYDSSLKSQDFSIIKTRLNENADLFNRIRDINMLDNPENEYSKFLDEDGIKHINDLEDWKNADYKILKTSIRNFEENKRKIKLLNSDVKDLVIWDKAEKDTSAGIRKRNILIFNPKPMNKIKIEFEFELGVTLNRSDLIGDDSKKDGSIRKNKLIFEFDVVDDIMFKEYEYKHNKLSSNRFNFKICVLNCHSPILECIKDVYTINKSKIQINQNEGMIVFGDDDSNIVSLYENNQIVDENSTLDVEQSFSNLENNFLDFSISYNNIFIPLSIKKIKPDNFPISSLDVWKKKISNQQDFIKIEDMIKQGDNLYNFKSRKFKRIVELEKQIVDNSIIYGKLDKGELSKIDISLSSELEEEYQKLFKYYKNKNNVPSLVYVDEDLKKIFSNILEVFNKEVGAIEENTILKNSEYKDYFKIGMIECDNKVWFSSISILNIAFQLEILNQCQNEDIGNNILKRLVPNNLLPYIHNSNNVLLKSISDIPAKEWLCYDEVSLANMTTSDVSVEKIVFNILSKFVDKFNYLFVEGTNAPLKINVINLENDKEVIKGIFKFIQDRLPDQRKSGNIIPIEVHIYNKNNKSCFNKFFECGTLDDLKSNFDLTIRSSLDSMDVIRLVQSNIEYFIHEDECNLGYAHISFYKVLGSSSSTELKMTQIDTGIGLDGLLSSIPSVHNDDYRSGFGLKYADVEKNLIETAMHLNELAYNNSKDGGAALYSKNKSIVTLYDDKDDKLMKLFDESHWVTFIEPTFGLDYFSNSKDLIVHYSDQYSASSQYDTITLTSKITPYKQVISDFLDELSIDNKDEVIDEVIKIFNSVNGEWLLNVKLRNNAEKEKLSIISAIKYALSIFNHEDILWVPISMEEILRVAGNTGLKESDGLFSVKALIGDKKGNSYSDDFLMMGFNIKSHEMYYYPIEVKMGVNPQSYINKAIKQVKTSYSFLREYLIDDCYSEKNIGCFRKKFYRNFFVQLYLVNIQKFINNNIWAEKEFERIDDFKGILLNDKYNISYKLESKIGKGAVVSFKEGATGQYLYEEEDITIIELPRIEGEKGIKYPISKFIKKIKNDEFDFNSEDLLYKVVLSSLTEKAYRDDVDSDFADVDDESDING